jgi:hypothetical protein
MGLETCSGGHSPPDALKIHIQCIFNLAQQFALINMGNTSFKKTEGGMHLRRKKIPWQRGMAAREFKTEGNAARTLTVWTRRRDAG